jgi:2-oxoisovalerate dehydrogenase E1 component alpha subunit
VLAVYAATREAAERARSERIPTLIEAVTYRLGPHSTADDRSRYQPEEEIEQWRSFDPLFRFRKFLETEDLIAHAFVEQVETDARDLAAEIRAGVAGAPPREPLQMFGWVFSDLPPHLTRQRDEVAALAETDEEQA